MSLRMQGTRFSSSLGVAPDCHQLCRTTCVCIVGLPLDWRLPVADDLREYAARLPGPCLPHRSLSRANTLAGRGQPDLSLAAQQLLPSDLSPTPSFIGAAAPGATGPAAPAASLAGSADPWSSAHSAAHSSGGPRAWPPLPGTGAGAAAPAGLPGLSSVHAASGGSSFAGPGFTSGLGASPLPVTSSSGPSRDPSVADGTERRSLEARAPTTPRGSPTERELVDGVGFAFVGQTAASALALAASLAAASASGAGTEGGGGADGRAPLLLSRSRSRRMMSVAADRGAAFASAGVPAEGAAEALREGGPSAGAGVGAHGGGPDGEAAGAGGAGGGWARPGLSSGAVLETLVEVEDEGGPGSQVGAEAEAVGGGCRERADCRA
jgi:hypothetical protein